MTTVQRVDGTAYSQTSEECTNLLSKLAPGNLSDLICNGLAYIRTDASHLLIMDINSAQNLALFSLYTFSHSDLQSFKLRLEHKTLGSTTDFSGALVEQGYTGVNTLAESYAATFHSIIPKKLVHLHYNYTHPVVQQRRVTVNQTITKKLSFSFEDQSIIRSRNGITSIDIGGVNVKKLHLFDMFLWKK